jgi:hypothetical protein
MTRRMKMDAAPYRHTQKHWINGSLADSLIRSLGLVRRGATFFYIPHFIHHTPSFRPERCGCVRDMKLPSLITRIFSIFCSSGTRAASYICRRFLSGSMTTSATIRRASLTVKYAHKSALLGWFISSWLAESFKFERIPHEMQIRAESNGCGSRFHEKSQNHKSQLDINSNNSDGAFPLFIRILKG